MTGVTDDPSPPSMDPLALAKELGMDICEEIKIPSLTLEAHKKIPFSLAIKGLVLAIEETDSHVSLAVANPIDFKLQEQIRWRLGKRVHVVVVPEEHLRSIIQKLYQSLDGNPVATIKPPDDGQEAVTQLDLLESSTGNPVADTLNRIFREAIAQGASDIHFEPTSQGCEIRLRIDGVLQTKNYDLRTMEAALSTRIKVLAQMDIAERRLPQDGRIKVVYSNREIDFRVSSVPVVYGERIVLRVLDKGGEVLNLDDLKMPSSITKSLCELSRMSEGILLVTGPTGSGKTTTLYSLLSGLPLDQINVMTIEDPVEYKLSGIAQIGVHPKIGLTFSRGLRHILRQDPDVIMIGEIRDLETAQIAIQASLTGHLVLSTLHTNDSVSAVTRLCDMGIEPYLIASSLVGVLAQRLARSICPHCRTSYEPSPSELEEIGISCKALYRGLGCDQCFGTGYRGRIGVYEIFRISSNIRSMIASKASLEQLRHEAEQHGLVSLRKSGLQLVIDGKTTLAEVMRITRGIEE